MSSDSHPESLRGTRRAKVFQPAQMTIGTVLRRVHLLDLSCAGALVHAADPPEVGTVVRFTGSEPLGLARVMWRRLDRFGVSFPIPLDQALVDRVAGPSPSPPVRAATGR